MQIDKAYTRIQNTIRCSNAFAKHGEEQTRLERLKLWKRETCRMENLENHKEHWKENKLTRHGTIYL